MQCQKCNNELEVDSKFCAHCGAPVSEDTILKMNEEKPIAKTKTFLFKTLAFFIAAFLTFIIKLILMGVGLLEVSSDFMKGGILLFLGLWTLLSGLFLKDTKKKKWGVWLLGAYVILSIAFGYFYNNSSFGIEQQIMEMNKNTPQRIDDDVEFTSVRINGDDVLMNYKLFNFSKNDFPLEKLDGLKNIMEPGFCNDESFAKVLDYGKNITASIYGNDNRLILDIHVSKGDCNKNIEETPQSLKNDESTTSSASKSSSSLGLMYPLDLFTINLLSESGRRYLKVEMTLELEDEALAMEIDANKVLFRDVIIRIVSGKSLEEISTVEGKMKLKEEIVSEINSHVKSGKVKEVYFIKYDVQ